MEDYRKLCEDNRKKFQGVYVMHRKVEELEERIVQLEQLVERLDMEVGYLSKKFEGKSICTCPKPREESSEEYKLSIDPALSGEDNSVVTVVNREGEVEESQQLPVYIDPNFDNLDEKYRYDGPVGP